MYEKRSIFIFTLSILFIFLPSLAHTADFNPHFIISDEALQDWQSMGRGEISSFLENKRSQLSQLQTPDLNGEIKPASEIIYQAAQAYKINPKYLLVKLQKEQSLVTDQTPSQRQLDWATGYAVCDACDTNDPRLEKFKGFGKQVDHAAGIMRWYYDHAGQESWIKQANQTYQIDGQTVVPANSATAFLYTYTPHLTGNQNFWRLWQQWFEAVYPNGTLLKSPSSTQVFVLDEGKKRPFRNMTALVTRYNPKLIITAPESELVRYPTGRMIDFPNYSIIQADTDFYLLDDDTLRPFASSSLVSKFGYNPDEIIAVEPSELADYALGTPITAESQYPTGRLLYLAANNTLYYLKDGTYFSIPDPLIAKVRFPNLKSKPGKPADFKDATRGGIMTFPDGTLLGITGTKNMFVMEKGLRRAFPSEAVFKALGYNKKNVVWVSEATADMYQIDEPIYAPAGAEDLLVTSTKGLAMVKATQKSNKKVPAKKVVPVKKAIPVKKTPAKKIVKSNVVKAPVSRFLYLTPHFEPVPTIFPETGKMIAVPATATTYIGPQFATAIDSYLVAKYTPGATSSLQILAGKNSDAPRPLASFTKVMTGYRLFAEGMSWDGSTTYAPSVHQTPFGYLFNIKPGESVLNRDLLNCFLVSSLNTAGRMLVQNFTGNDEKSFIARMNEQARAWGLTKTYFTDVHGYALGNQSTAREYATIFAHALAEPTLANVLGTTQYDYTELIDTDNFPVHHKKNSNELALAAGLPYTVLASKTGYLYESGYGIVMLVERPSDRAQFLIVTMGNPDYDKKYSAVDKLTRWTLTL